MEDNVHMASLPKRIDSFLQRADSSQKKSVNEAFALLAELRGYYSGLEMDATFQEDVQKKTSNLRSQLLERASFGFFMLSKELTVIDLNSSAASMLYHDKSSILHASFPDLIAQDNRETCIEFFNRLLAGDNSAECELGVISEGQKFYMRLVGTADPENHSFYAFARDITSFRHMESQIQRLSLAVDQSPISVIITNKDGIIEYVNDAFCRTSQYNRSELIGKSPRIFNSGHHDKEFFTELWNTVLSGKEFKAEMLNKKKSGEVYWEAVSIYPIMDENNRITNFVDIKMDVSARKRMMEELVTAKVKAEEISRLKSNFFASMSHELISPLVAMLGLSDILAVELVDAAQIDTVQNIKESGERLKHTLNMILELTKTEKDLPLVHLENRDVVPIIYGTAKLFEAEARKKGLLFEFIDNATSRIAKVDYQLLIDAAINLIRNAIAYTHTGSITVTVSSHEDEANGKIIINIADTGIGIDSEMLDVVFEEFRQASEGAYRTYEGVGLGLSLAKRYIEKMHGTISLESTPGKGSVFTIILPAVKE